MGRFLISRIEGGLSTTSRTERVGSRERLWRAEPEHLFPGLHPDRVHPVEDDTESWRKQIDVRGADQRRRNKVCKVALTCIFFEGNSGIASYGRSIRCSESMIRDLARAV